MILSCPLGMQYGLFYGTRIPQGLFFQRLGFFCYSVAYSCSKVSLQLKPPVGPWVRGRMGGSVSCHIPVSPSSSQEQKPRYGIFRTICTKSLEFCGDKPWSWQVHASREDAWATIRMLFPLLLHSLIISFVTWKLLLIYVS